MIILIVVQITVDREPVTRQRSILTSNFDSEYELIISMMHYPDLKKRGPAGQTTLLLGFWFLGSVRFMKVLISLQNEYCNLQGHSSMTPYTFTV